jgi:hypothetical protein
MSCPVCFNAATSDDTVRTSLNFGIFVLMGVTACVLGGFLRFIISIARRSYGQADLLARRSPGEGGKVRPYARTPIAQQPTFVETDLQVRLPS